MKERPILFSGPMVRAILEGRKSQTRRVVKRPIESECIAIDGVGNGEFVPVYPCQGRPHGIHGPYAIRCPYGVPGDRLWVRETTIRVEEHGYVGPIYVASDDGSAILNWGLGPGDDYADVDPHNVKLRPAIHMPRSMSRLTLEIKAVRVERLHEISEEDARAEGITDGGCLSCGESEPCGCANPRPDARDAFAFLWHSMTGSTNSWHANPWVWVIEFERVD